ncbi:hypothetical protein E4U60_003009 [Claviceps pazoutovae]|uniref:Uncharacterized protein n=1 Tax=Claviceps pazoutovae TaxID=1649127 RepID=A0A9P7MAF2_9HYPO|nr:hypothetical protein E4U60_003009 [Claviceps pazoutovae]
MTLISCQISGMGAARRKFILTAASAGSKEGNKNTAKGADVPCTDPDSVAKQAASDEATSNNTHNAQAEGDKQQL